VRRTEKLVNAAKGPLNGNNVASGSNASHNPPRVRGSDPTRSHTVRNSQRRSIVKSNHGVRHGQFTLATHIVYRQHIARIGSGCKAARLRRRVGCIRGNRRQLGWRFDGGVAAAESKTNRFGTAAKRLVAVDEHVNAVFARKKDCRGVNSQERRVKHGTNKYFQQQKTMLKA
jgi:hypothetical protein